MRYMRILIRNFRDGIRSVFRNFSLSIASITCITITLILVAIAIVISANVSYDDTPYRQVKRLLPVINLIINDYTKYLVDESNTN